MTAIQNVRGYAKLCAAETGESTVETLPLGLALQAALVSDRYPVIESIGTQVGESIEFQDLAAVEEERLKRELNDLAWSFAGGRYRVVARIEYSRWDGTKVEFAVNQD
jgi:hypothetical protein